MELITSCTLSRDLRNFGMVHIEALHVHGLGMKKLTDCSGVDEWVGGWGEGWGLR